MARARHLGRAPQRDRSRRDALTVPTVSLVHKVSGASKLRGVIGGDWDRRTVLIADTAKHRSMVQRFVDGIEWEDTELFRDAIPRRLATGLAFRDTFDLHEIAAFYRAHFDPLFASIKREGFRRKNPPHVLIARTGEVMLGNQGNHRVAMAKIIGIASIPCEVVCRHLEAA